jgi:pimeloyl-ACP methyl ester carboxylesterase
MTTITHRWSTGLTASPRVVVDPGGVLDHRLLGDVQPSCYRGVGAALGDQFEDVALAGVESFEDNPATGTTAPVVADGSVLDTPVLILDGGLDAITAPPNGELVARSLPKATRLLFPDSAHDVLLWSTPCALPVMQSFLDGLSGPDTRCLTTVAPAAFAL